MGSVLDHGDVIHISESGGGFSGTPTRPPVLFQLSSELNVCTIPAVLCTMLPLIYPYIHAHTSGGYSAGGVV